MVYFGRSFAFFRRMQKHSALIFGYIDPNFDLENPCILAHIHAGSLTAHCIRYQSKWNSRMPVVCHLGQPLESQGMLDLAFA